MKFRSEWFDVYVHALIHNLRLVSLQVQYKLFVVSQGNVLNTHNIIQFLYQIQMWVCFFGLVCCTAARTPIMRLYI